jgi:hypothetical protein
MRTEFSDELIVNLFAVAIAQFGIISKALIRSRALPAACHERAREGACDFELYRLSGNLKRTSMPTIASSEFATSFV